VLAGAQTLQGLVFNGNGGGGASPTVSTGEGLLTIGSGGIVSNPFNPAATPLVVGRVDLGTSANIVTVNTFDFNGFTNYAPTTAGLILGGLLGSSGGFTKNGAGLLQINQSTFTGAVNVTAGGILSGAANSGSRFSTLQLGAGTNLNLNGQNTIWGALSGSGAVINSAANSPTLTVGFNNADTTFSGQINRFNDATPNAVNLTKTGTGTMTVDVTQSATAASTGTVTVAGGGITYSGANGRALMPTQTVMEGGVLTLDNTATAVSGRLASPLTGGANTLNINGGQFVILPNASTSVTETLSTLTVGAGAGEMLLDAVTNSGITLNVTTLTNVQTGGTLWLRGDFNPAGGNTVNNFARVFVTNFNTVGGQGGGANGSTTMTIRPDMIGSAVDGSGLSFITRDSVTTNLLRPLASNEVSASLINSSITNISLSSNATMSFSQNINSLMLNSGGGISNGNVAAFGKFNSSATLLTENVRTGGVIAFEGNAGLNLPAINSLSGFFVFHTIGDATTLAVNGHVGNANGGGLWKSGTGTLRLNARSFYTGQTTVNEGTLVLNGGDNTIVLSSSATAGIYQNLLMNGGTLDLNGTNQMLGTLFTTNPLAVGGTVTNTSGTAVTLRTNTGNNTFAGVLAGNLSYEQSGGGSLVFSNQSTYTGTTVVRGGALILRDNGALAGTSAVAVNYATLDWDNTGLNPLGGDNPERLGASKPVSLQGGALTIRGGGSADTAVSLNSLAILRGGSTVNIVPTFNAGSAVQLTLGNIVRASGDHGVVNFVAGNGFGMGGSGNNNNARVLVSAINGAGFAASQMTNNLVGGWAVVNGDSFATYLDGVGLGALGSTVGGNAFAGGNVFPGYNGGDITATGTQASWNINDGSNRTLTASKTINSLRMAPGGAQTITLGNDFWGWSADKLRTGHGHYFRQCFFRDHRGRVGTFCFHQSGSHGDQHPDHRCG
jgi:autotransporter-associated beta strand protein